MNNDRHFIKRNATVTLNGKFMETHTFETWAPNEKVANNNIRNQARVRLNRLGFGNIEVKGKLEEL